MIIRFGQPNYEIDMSLMNEIGSYMDDEIREDLHDDLATIDPTASDNERFLRAYCDRDDEFESLLKHEFDIELD